MTEGDRGCPATAKRGFRTTCGERRNRLKEEKPYFDPDLPQHGFFLTQYSSTDPSTEPI